MRTRTRPNRHPRKSPLRLILAACVVVAAAPNAPRAADDVSVRASLDPATIAVGESATLTVRVDGALRGVGEPELPDVDGLSFYSAGTSRSMQWINGRMSTSLEYTYLVSADREGTYRISPVRVRVGDRDYTADALTLHVVGARGSVPAPGGGGAPVPAPRGGTARAPRPDASAEDAAARSSIFVRAHVDRDTVYVGQQVTWTLGYYTDGRVALLRSPSYTAPEATGFWVEDLPQHRYETTLDGRRFSVTEIRRACFPTAPGVAVIGPATVDIVVDAFTTRGLLDEFFSRGWSGGLGGKHYALRSDSIRVVVLPLPARGRPAGFTGAVATDVRLQASIDRQRTRVGEPVTLTVTVDGAGNMQAIALPEFPAPDGFRVYEGEAKSSTFRQGESVRGRKSMQYVLVPRRAGRFTLPPVELAYFDPEAGAYRVARTLPVTLTVDPGEPEGERRVVYAGRGEGFRVVDRDVRYIHAATPALRIEPPADGAARRALLRLVPLLAVALALFAERRRLRREDDSPEARAARALEVATRTLAEARRALEAGEVDRAASRAGAALRGYFADRLGESRAGITRERILSALGDDERAREVMRLLDAFEAASYAGAAGAVDAAAIARAHELLRALEKEALR